MGSTILIRVSFLAACFLWVTAVFADNPIIQTNYTADPAPMVKGDTVFLYTSHDEDNAQGFVMKNWMLYTSTDLVNWTDRGIIASLQNFSWENGNAWAPQCAFRNGKYYLYCPLNKKGGNISIGVLVASSPYGPFTDPLNKPLVTDNSSGSDYDPSIFVDDDGQAYLYFGGNGPCFYVKLNEDMISLAGAIQKASIEGATGTASYTEGPWLYKHFNKYYLAWASRCCPEGIGYAMSNTPTGPWKCKGVIMAPSDSSSGNHPGLMDFKGKSYVFGFNYSLLYSRIPYSTSKPERRSICMKEMTFNADSSIKEVPWWGNHVPMKGVDQIGVHNPYSVTQAETICWSFGVRTEVCKDTGGGMDVDSIHNGDYIKVKGVDFGTGGAKLFEARVASATSGGSIEIHLDTLAGPLAGTCAVAGTGGAQTWTTKSCSISGATGVHDVWFKFTGGSGLLFNFNWWKFTAATGIGPEARIGLQGNSISIAIDARKSQSLIVDFSKPMAQKNVRVCLFDLIGRQVAELINGPLDASRLSLPLDRMEALPGVYFVKVSISGAAAVTKTITIK